MRERPKAVRFRAPRQVDVVTEEERPCPEGSARARTLYSGISAGTELTAYRGSNVYLNKLWDPDRRLFVPGEQSVTYPLVGWGYSEVGEVVEVANSRSAKADSTAGITVGDVVHGVWGHRSEGVLPTADLEGQVIPPDQDPVIGVFARVGAIALNAVLAADIHVTESVVITGQGVIGLLATRLAVLSGANVIAVDGIAGRRGVAQNFGASDVVDPTTTDVAVRVRELIGSGADVAIELSGAYSALHAAIRSVSPGGRVVAAGFYQGPATGLDLGEEFHHNRVTIVGSQIGGVPAGLDPRWDRARLSRAFLDLVTSGRLDVLPLVTHVVPVDEAATAYRLLDQNPTGVLQVVLDFRSSEGGGAPSTQA